MQQDNSNKRKLEEDVDEEVHPAKKLKLESADDKTVEKRPDDEKVEVAPSKEEAVNNTSISAQPESNEASKQKRKKTKIALLVGYDGSKYNGSQTQPNPELATVEDILFQAIKQAGGVSEDNDLMKKVGWGRTSRTDKGVHAVINLIGLKMIVEDENIVEKLNSELQKIIEQRNLSPLMVYDYIRTVGSFDPKSSCDGRRYLYVMPTYSFEQIFKLTDEQKVKTENAVRPESYAAISMEELIESRSFIEGYRISAERLQKVRDLFSKYIGTRSYHNFTKKGKKSDMKAANRFITNISISDPFCIDGGVEHVTVRLDGQSFLLNQIRKMIGFVVAIMRGHIDESNFDVVFKQDVNFFVPMAPGAGLLLDDMVFTHYNKRYGPKYGDIDFTRDIWKDKLNSFRDVILKNIVSREGSEQVMARWLYKLPHIVYSDLLQPGVVRPRPTMEVPADKEETNQGSESVEKPVNPKKQFKRNRGKKNKQKQS